MLTTKNLSKRNLLYVYATWWLGYTAVQSLVLYHSFQLDLNLSIYDAVLTNVVLATSAYAMINIVRVYQPTQSLRVVYSIGLAVIAIFIMQWLASITLNGYVGYEEFLNRSFIIRCFFAWIMISLFSTSASLWYYLSEQRELDQRKAMSEKLAREAELSKLRLQLQPHFLFNSLNSISALAGSKPEEARKMIQQLSDFLRGTLKKDDQQLVTFSEELTHLQLYLDIEKVRFGHRLKTHIEEDEQSAVFKLPPLLLQPIVENAIKFGLYDTIGEIVIRIKAKAEDNYLVITVENPFDVQTAKPKQGTGFGLSAVQRRLYLLYARNDLLTTGQDEVTFTTTVKIPQTV